MQYVLLGIGLAGLVFSIFWVRKPESKKDRFFGWFSLVGCAAMIVFTLWLLLSI